MSRRHSALAETSPSGAASRAGTGGVASSSLLPPQAKQMLDEALAAAPDHPHGEQAKMLDTLQKMTAHL